MSDHTPTPWRVEDGTDLIWGACNPDDQSTYGMGYSIVEGKLPGWKPYKPSEDERKANAAFIVKAVNNYGPMLSLLKECLSDYGHPNFTDRHGMADRIRKVLGAQT